jgi:signal transduction histidine kinase
VNRPHTPNDFQSDIDAVQRIDAVPRILEVVCRTTGMGFAAVARVTEDRWVCCAVRDEIQFGLAPGGELKVETTICDEIRDSGEAVVIDQVSQDQAYCRHPTPAMYGFQSYISMPIVLPDGTFFGTLCAIDPRPAQLKSPQTIGMFKLFAELIATHLGAVERMDRAEASLDSERHDAELREQFIAVLGHDLRNPLASIQAGIRLLGKAQPPEKASEIFGMMHNSITRMSKLVDNVMDFARGRLGGGITLDLALEDLGPALKQVIDEVRTGYPGSTIESHVALPERIKCDRARIGQLFSNLLANAATHGEKGKPIKVSATTSGGRLELSVTNAGGAISEAAMKNLFKPFHRGVNAMQGLGLGLYIASEIGRAHNGALDVTSTPEQTRFTFRMPIA